MAEALIQLAGVYFGCGLGFALAFAARGVSRIDPDARGAGLGFRMLLIPGAALLWPSLLARWVRGTAPPNERNAHRIAARFGGRTRPDAGTAQPAHAMAQEPRASDEEGTR